MMDSVFDLDLPEYIAPQVYSCRYLDPSILELNAEQAIALGLPAVPLQRLPYDDEFGSSRWVEREEFENAHHQELFRLPDITNLFDLEDKPKADVGTENVFEKTEQLRKDSVIGEYRKRKSSEDDLEMEQDAKVDDEGTTPISNGMRKRRCLASPILPSSFPNQGVSSKSEGEGSQLKPIVIDSDPDEDDAPQPPSTIPIVKSTPMVIDSESDEDDTSQPVSSDPIDVNSKDEDDEDDAPQAHPAATTTTNYSFAAPTTSNVSTSNASAPSTTGSSTSSSSSSSSRAPPGTWTTDLRFLINEVIRNDGSFNASSLECAQVIKALYPDFALAHLPDKELAKRVKAQWKERDYPNRADWVRIRAMRVQDEGIRAGVRARVRGTGILS